MVWAVQVAWSQSLSSHLTREAHVGLTWSDSVWRAAIVEQGTPHIDAIRATEVLAEAPSQLNAVVSKALLEHNGLPSLVDKGIDMDIMRSSFRGVNAPEAGPVSLSYEAEARWRHPYFAGVVTTARMAVEVSDGDWKATLVSQEEPRIAEAASVALVRADRELHDIMASAVAGEAPVRTVTIVEVFWQGLRRPITQGLLMGWGARVEWTHGLCGLVNLSAQLAIHKDAAAWAVDVLEVAPPAILQRDAVALIDLEDKTLCYAISAAITLHNNIAAKPIDGWSISDHADSNMPVRDSSSTSAGVVEVLNLSAVSFLRVKAGPRVARGNPNPKPTPTPEPEPKPEATEAKAKAQAPA